MTTEIKKVRCNKTLIGEDNEQNFTEGKTYQGYNTNLLRNLNVKDDQDVLHTLGHWYKHFTVIPERNNFS